LQRGATQSDDNQQQPKQSPGKSHTRGGVHDQTLEHGVRRSAQLATHSGRLENIPSNQHHGRDESRDSAQPAQCLRGALRLAIEEREEDRDAGCLEERT
jgi:hypothetical protein